MNTNSAKRKKKEKYLGFNKHNDGRYNFVNERKEKKVKVRYNCKTWGKFDCEKMSGLESETLV